MPRRKRKPRRQTKRQRKRIEKARSVIDTYVEHAAEVFPRHFTKDCCINATRVLVEVMAHFGVSAQPLSVSCVAHNKILVDCIEKHRGSLTEAEVDEAYDNGAWGVRIETGKQVKPNGWPGHLVAVVNNKWLVDSSAGQMSRPHKGIQLPPIVVVPATRRFQSGDELCVLTGPEGALLLYEAKPGDTSYVTASGWERHPGNLAVVAEVIEAMEGNSE
jgi:hypothetical protein